MNLSSLRTLPKKTLVDGIRVLTSKEELKALFRVSLYRNAVYLMLNSAVTAVIGFVFWVLAARLYTAEEVGLASAAIAVAGFLVTLANFGLDFGLVRFLRNSGQKSNTLVNSCFTIGGLAAIVSSLIFLAGLNVWSPALIQLRQVPFLLSFVIAVVAWAIYILLHNIFVAHKRADLTLFEGIIQSVIKLALVIVFATLTLSFGLLASWGLGFAFALLIGILVFLPRIQSGYRPALTISRKAVSEMARFSLANYVVDLISRVPGFVLPLMVVQLLGTEQNAYFYIAYAVISNALLLIPASISLSLFAEGSHDEDALGEYVKRSLKFSLLILVPLIIIVFLIGDILLLLLGNAYSQESTRLLWVLALASLPATINTIYFYKKRVEKKMNAVLNLNILATVIVLAVTYFLLPVMGIIGAGIGWLAGNGAVTLVIIGELLRKRGISFGV
jgi:O-antigen/teichoic acid export membrane protein